MRLDQWPTRLPGELLEAVKPDLNMNRAPNHGSILFARHESMAGSIGTGEPIAVVVAPYRCWVNHTYPHPLSTRA